MKKIFTFLLFVFLIASCGSDDNTGNESVKNSEISSFTPSKEELENLSIDENMLKNFGYVEFGEELSKDEYGNEILLTTIEFTGESIEDLVVAESYLKKYIENLTDYLQKRSKSFSGRSLLVDKLTLAEDLLMDITDVLDDIRE